MIFCTLLKNKYIFLWYINLILAVMSADKLCNKDLNILTIT